MNRPGGPGSGPARDPNRVRPGARPGLSTLTGPHRAGPPGSRSGRPVSGPAGGG